MRFEPASEEMDCNSDKDTKDSAAHDVARIVFAEVWSAVTYKSRP